jgi:hypothetical protein
VAIIKNEYQQKEHTGYFEGAEGYFKVYKKD